MRKIGAVVLSMGLLFSGVPVAHGAPPVGAGNSSSAPGQAKRESSVAVPAPTIEVPSVGRAAGRNIAENVGVPDFVQLPQSPSSNPGNAIGNPDSAVPNPQPGNSGNAPGRDAGVGAGIADLTPPGLVRRLDTPAAAKAKFSDLVKDECQEVLDGGTGESCATTNYIIRYKVGSDIEAESRGLGQRQTADLSGVIPGLAAKLSAKDLAELAQFSTVLSIEPDQVISVETVQSDAEWGLDRIDQVERSPLDGYNYQETGSGVDVYVVDTGVLGTHQEFSGRVSTGYSAVADGPGNLDCNGHGTHVAGSIAGLTYGVAKEANIIPVRVLDCNGSGALSGVISGLSWISQNYDGRPAVVNMSLGGGASASLDAAVQTLVDRGITVVVAAGNASLDACTFSPARVQGAITVAASTALDALASYSNFGGCVDLIAPGSGVRSAFIGTNTSTQTLSGTSMAAPHVAGVVAQLLQLSQLAPTAVESAILQAAAGGMISGDLRGTPNRLLQIVSRNSESRPDPNDPGADAPVTEEPVQSDPADTEVRTKPVAPGKAKVRTKGPKAEITWAIPSVFAKSLTSQYLRVYAFGEFVSEIEVETSTNSVVLDGLELGLGYSVTLVLENEFGRSVESLQSDTFRPRPLQKPSDGEFTAWVKKINDSQVKFYVKFPQVGKKIQFMYQGADGTYRELAWLRIGANDLNESGQYVDLTNSVYFVRTLNLEDGKNRLRILVDGVQVGATRTYSR